MGIATKNVAWSIECHVKNNLFAVTSSSIVKLWMTHKLLYIKDYDVQIETLEP